MFRMSRDGWSATVCLSDGRRIEGRIVVPAEQDGERSRSLSVVGQESSERADAARNRRRILAAAESIVAERGVAELSVADVARSAGVGVGTIYRRFGDRAGLVATMMNERERALQRSLLDGPPPLGPGAPPVERARAFLHAYVDLLDAYAELMEAIEASMPAERRYGGGAYAVHHRHLALLIEEARPDLPAEYRADVLLASLSPGLIRFQRVRRGMGLDQIKTGLDGLLDDLLDPR